MIKDKKFQTFLKDRRNALLSLDRKIIIEYYQKYNIQLPADELSMWAGIHMARIECNDIPHDEKLKSRQWLSDHDFKTL
jgi:hypothetical protein